MSDAAAAATVSPAGEIVLPDRFLPTAAEFGLISEIDRWVVNETARLAAQGHPVECNLSAKSVVDPNMLTIVQRLRSPRGTTRVGGVHHRDGPPARHRCHEGVRQ